MIEHVQSTEVTIRPTKATLQAQRDDDIIQAVRHHRRALTSLRGITFERLSASMTKKLVNDLTDNLRLLERELERRGLDVSTVHHAD